jgi:hypothetical protein
MPSAKNALGILLVTMVGIWGCAQSSTPNTADRLKALELKNAQLEDDFRTAAAVRDQLRRRVVAMEEEQRRLLGQLELEIQDLARDRDALRRQLAERTTERDAVLAHFDHFRKGLKELIGQTEAALPRFADPDTTHVNADAPND